MFVAANLQKFIREAVPSELRVASELTDMIVECCTGGGPFLPVEHCLMPAHQTFWTLHQIELPYIAEFVEMISSSANEVSTQDKKTTINPEHVLKALEDLGFVDLQKSVNTYWQQWKEDSKGKQLY